jgi:hypothetical protein
LRDDRRQEDIAKEKGEIFAPAVRRSCEGLA